MEEQTSATTLNLNIQNQQTKVFKLSLNQILKPAMFLLFAILYEVINFATLGLQFLPKYFLFDLGAFLIFAGIIFLVPKNWLSNIFFFFFLGIQFVLNVANGTMLLATEDVFFFELLSLASEAKSSFDWSFINFNSIIYNCILLVISIISVVLVDIFAKRKKFKVKKITKPLLMFIVVFCSWIIGLTFYSSEILYLHKSKDKDRYAAFHSELWNELEYKISGLESFGTYGFYLKDFYNSYIRKIDYDSKLNEYVDWIKKGEVEKNESATLFDQNLIMICMESIDQFALDPYNTPTLWNLCYGDEFKNTAGKGIFLDNFYSKNKTNISEDISLLGYVAKTTMFNAEKDSISVKYSLPNLFKALGYKTNYFHSFKKDFYSRSTINKNIGFENLYFLEDIDFENKNLNFNTWNSEVDFFNAAKDKMIPTDGNKFFSFYMTVSGHGTYDIENPNFEKKGYYDTYDSNLSTYQTWLKNNTDFTYPKDSETAKLYRQFKCAAMDTDAMVAELIEHLTSSGLLEKTTIVLFADHDCFYNNMSSVIKGQDSGQEKYNIPCIIYDGSETLASEVISDFTTVYSIYPTICDLYGLAYNTNMCHGVSIFDADQSNNVMYSTEAIVGYFDKNCQSVTLMEVNKANGKVTQADVDKFMENANRLREKQKKLNFIYKAKWKVNVLN